MLIIAVELIPQIIESALYILMETRKGLLEYSLLGLHSLLDI
jgi:hypothetical protein